MAAANNNFVGIGIPSAYFTQTAATTAPMAIQSEPAPDVQRLTARMSKGDEAAFHEFYGLYFNRLLRYLFLLTGGQEEVAREALQLAFVRVARRVRKFDSETAFWNWLAVLARNCAVDELRKRTRQKNLIARFFQQRPAEANSPGEQSDEHFLTLVEKEICNLPDEERLLLERKYFAGESARFLAEEFQITEKAMESRLLRIRRKLKALVLDRLKNETSK
jgi:RNA polymerase sigma-70 factor, ECF subfamily